MADDDKSTSAAVYVSWATFSNAMAQLAQGLPNRIDRSVFPGQSWAVQGQLLAALKFLGLISDDGKPLPSLVAVAVPDEEARKVMLRRIIQEKYSELFALDLMKTTPAELSEKMGAAYSVSGDTRGKAVRFFLAAATQLGIPVSPRLAREKPKSGNGAGAPRRRRVVRQRQADQPEDPSAPPPPPRQQAGTSKVIMLRSGGMLTLSADVDVLKLKGKDRDFVFDLIDKIDAYEQESEG